MSSWIQQNLPFLSPLTFWNRKNLSDLIRVRRMPCFPVAPSQAQEQEGWGESVCPMHRVLPTMGAERVREPECREPFTVDGGSLPESFLVITAVPAQLLLHWGREGTAEWMAVWSWARHTHPHSGDQICSLKGQGVHLHGHQFHLAADPSPHHTSCLQDVKGGVCVYVHPTNGTQAWQPKICELKTYPRSDSVRRRGLLGGRGCETGAT